VNLLSSAEDIIRQVFLPWLWK